MITARKTMLKPRALFIVLMAFTMQACGQGNTPVAASKAAPAKTAFQGDDAVISAALKKIAPGVEITRIKASPLPGLKEVIVDGRVLYVSADGKYLLQGSLIEMPSRRNLSQASEAVERKALLAGIPAAQKISFAPSNPQYRVTVFTDIDCGFCRKMHDQIAEYNKLGIAVDYLFYPRAGFGSESFQKAVNVACAANKQVALTNAKAGRELPKKNCTNSVLADYNLGEKAGVGGTPAVYASNGFEIGGYLSPRDMLSALQKLNK
jgi:thiol:disulfide interchange protein DsbC